MAGRVFNALGGTLEDPCPTAITRWFGTGYCNKNDYQAWLQAASDMYDLGLLPTYEQLDRLKPGPEVQALWVSLDAYRQGYEKLPTRGSISPNKNWELCNRVMSLMGVGDLLITKMQESIEAAGETPTELPRKQPDAPPPPKPAWQKWGIPAAAAAFGLVVGGVVIYAATRGE